MITIAEILYSRPYSFSQLAQIALDHADHQQSRAVTRNGHTCVFVYFADDSALLFDTDDRTVEPA